MNELTVLNSTNISKHNFDKYKNDLKKFSEQENSDFQISRVDTSTLMFFDHKVTGEELNRITRQVGNHLIDLNKRQIEITKEFRVIYDAFESLDKDYISGIIASLKSAEKAYDETQKAQKDIQRTMYVQEKIIEGLENFKNRLDSKTHLEDIDDMWENTQQIAATMNYLNAKITNLEDERNDLLAKNEQLAEIINNKKEESEKLKKLNIAVIILFVLVIVNFVVSNFR
ncbi:MAG TPA: hypothetical protein H9953_02970 [Candidatus Fusicatenibacter intestinipullorum]|nr:hypothetical protein [Candidatus Fusicatenibacter intestinipullorum]